MGGRPGSAVVGLSGAVVMVSSEVSRTGQRRTASYDGHQNRLASRPELIAAPRALGRARTEPGRRARTVPGRRARTVPGRRARLVSRADGC
ncbi:hypothetical protein GCM10017744_087730 [Streptomyces antimycoticus]